MTRSNIQNSFRVMNLPVFPQVHEDGSAPDPDELVFSPNELLGGFLVGKENRLAELATHFANEGVPIFDRPLGDRAVEPLVEAAREPSRADVEMLFSSAVKNASPQVPSDVNILFEQETFNRLSSAAGGPIVLGYKPLETIPFLAPLVFYGPSGSGKTRLVEGICQRRRLLYPRQTLYYLSAFDFSQALNDAIRRDQTELFGQLFSQASVVAIENADMLATREAAQIAFLPMLDAAIKARKLIVLTFSQIPTSIPGFLPDLAARFSAGLLIPTYLPSNATREYAIDRVVQKLGLRIDFTARTLLIDRLPSTLGGICATLTQLAREFAAFSTPPTCENIQNYLARRNPVKDWTLDKIVKATAKYFAISVVEMRSKKRLKTLVLARKYVAFLARCLTKATLQEIGDQFSSRDHSTIVYSIREIEEALKTDEQTRHDLREIARMLDADDVLKL